MKLTSFSAYNYSAKRPCLYQNFGAGATIDLPIELLSEIIFKSTRYHQTPGSVLTQLHTVSKNWDLACYKAQLLLCNFIAFDRVFSVAHRDEPSGFRFLAASGAKLQTLEISRELPEKDLALILESTPNLKSLCLESSTDSIRDIIAEKATKLENLKIDVSIDFDEPEPSLSFLKSLLLLEKLHASIDDEAKLKYISNLTKLTSLTLEAEYHEGGDLERLTALQNLKELNLEIGRPNSWSFISNFTKLESFTFTSNSYRYLQNQDLQSIAQLTTLRHLEVKPCSLTREGLTYLSHFVNLQSLSIHAGINKLSLEGMSFLPHLKILKLSQVEDFGRISEFTSLVKLRLHPQKGDLLHLSQLTNLTHLELSQIEEKGVLDGLYCLNSLEKLTIDYVRRIVNTPFPITDQDMYATSSLTKLHSLKIYVNLLTPKGQQILMELHNMAPSHSKREYRSAYRRQA